MSKVLILKGLPASGKSTYARELVDKGNWIVNYAETREFDFVCKLVLLYNT